MNVRDSWPAFAIMVFAVASGQIGRMGQAYERGASIGLRQVFIELSMLPAFGSAGGALAIEYHWPAWSILIVGIAAGWTGFASFRIIMTIARTVMQQVAGGKSDTP